MPTPENPFEDADLAPYVPLVLGVTGHREIWTDSEQAIRVVVGAIFSNLKGRFPSSPLRVLSSLAPGADQLVAEVAREHGITVWAPLPFPPEIYAASSSFERFPLAVTKFHEWIASGDAKAFVVPLPDGPDHDDQRAWNEFAQDREKRQLCYANAGGYIVGHCHILIGLWDGKFSGLHSGTEEIIQYKLFGRRPVLYPWRKPLDAGDEAGPVYIVQTPREAPANDPLPLHPATALKAGDLQVSLVGQDYLTGPQELRWKPSSPERLLEVIAPSGKRKSLYITTWRQFIRKIQAIDDFNRDVAADSKRPALLQRLGKKKGTTLWHWIEAGRLPRDLHRLVFLRETAAVLAGQLEGAFFWWQLALFFAVFCSVFSFDVYDHSSLIPLWMPPLLLKASLVGIMICFLIAGWVRYRRINERRLDYRALAETLRVRIYWGVAGLGTSVADSYLGQLRGEISWARLAMKVSAPPPAFWKEYFGRQNPERQLEQLSLVEKDWVNAQEQFYFGSFSKRKKRAFWLRTVGMEFVGIAMLLMLFLAVFGNGFGHDADLLVSANTSVLLAALLLLYSERQSHEDLAKQYERMTETFRSGVGELKVALHNQPENIKAAQETISALGYEAISEHSQWLILRRNRPFEVPVP